MASERAKTVLAIDQQSEAVACTRNNVALNGLQAKIEVRQGDLFAAVHTGETFDVIVFNIPYVPWKPETPWQAANFDEGHQLLRRFLTQAKRYLRPGGRVVMTWSDIGDTAYLHTLLEEQGYAYKVLVERQARDIGFYIYELRAFGEG